MGFALGDLFLACLFFINAVAVLNEQRFLARIGWTSSSSSDGFGQQQSSMKARLMTLISSVQTLLRIPLIFVNVLVILYQLVLG